MSTPSALSLKVPNSCCEVCGSDMWTLISLWGPCALSWRARKPIFRCSGCGKRLMVFWGDLEDLLTEAEVELFENDVVFFRSIDD